MQIALATRLAELEASVPPGERRAVTLAKEHGLTLMLMHLAEGNVLAEHSAPGPVTVHVLRGQVRLTVAGDEMTAREGEIVLIEPSAPHSVAALEASTLLLTVASDQGAG